MNATKMNPVENMPSLVPELLVRSITASRRFYCEALGFEIAFERPEHGFAMVRLGDAWLMLEQTDSLDVATEEDFVVKHEWRTAQLDYPFGRGINLQIVVKDVAALVERLSVHGYALKAPPETRSYRTGDTTVTVEQFLVMDPDGYLLRFQQEKS